MADQIKILKQLQAVDAELFQCRKVQKQKPQELEQVTAEVAAQTAKVKLTDERLKSLQLSQKEKEVELQTHEASVKKLQGQLFQVKTNKEYSTMQREIDTLKADNSMLEETILKRFEEIDAASQERQREQRLLAEHQERLRREQQRIEQELAALAEQMAQLEKRRQTILPDVPQPTLVTYERILSIRDGLALVPLISESCGGCHRRLPPQVISQVYLQADLVTCESCNRILYSDEAHSKL